MYRRTMTIATYTVALSFAALLATAAAVGAAMAAPGEPSDGRAHARIPQRGSTRVTSFDWMSDVRTRLRVLERHSAGAEHARFARQTSPLGRLYPRLPAAGDGARR